jgi:hypothetical protein
MSVCPSAWNSDGFSWKCISEYFFENLSRKFKFLYKVRQQQRVLYMKTYVLYIYDSTLLSSFRIRTLSHKICREDQNTIFLFNTFYRKTVLFFEINVEKDCLAEEATDDSIIRRMRLECWITKATNPTLRMCNTYCFSAVTMVTPTCPNIALYVHCLSC